MPRRGTSTLRMAVVRLLGMGSAYELRCERCHHDGDPQNTICNGGGDLEIHHIIPVSEGGTNDDGNLICLCEKCHLEAHRVLREPWPGGTGTPWPSGLIRLRYEVEHGRPRAREALAYLTGMRDEREWQEKHGSHESSQASEPRIAEAN
jgi:hypothetical protein